MVTKEINYADLYQELIIQLDELRNAVNDLCMPLPVIMNVSKQFVRQIPNITSEQYNHYLTLLRDTTDKAGDLGIEFQSRINDILQKCEELNDLPYSMDKSQFKYAINVNVYEDVTVNDVAKQIGYHKINCVDVNEPVQTFLELLHVINKYIDNVNTKDINNKVSDLINNGSCCIIGENNIVFEATLEENNE